MHKAVLGCTILRFLAAPGGASWGSMRHAPMAAVHRLSQLPPLPNRALAGWPSVLFFVAWVTVGKWLILTLFLAITLSAFEQSYASVTRTTTGGASQRGEARDV